MKERKTKIIEFVGLHGSGKTTTAYMLAERLKNDGFTVKTNHDFWLEVQGIHRLKRFFMYTLHPYTLGFIIRASLQICFRRVKLNQVQNKYQTHTISGPMKDIILRDFIFLKKWKDVDYIIVDEGSIYVTTDLVWKYKLPFSLIKKYLLSSNYLKLTKIFLFNSSVDLSVRRTGERNNGSFIDNLSPEERKKELAEVIGYCQQTYNFLESNKELSKNIIKLDPEEPLELRLARLIVA